MKLSWTVFLGALAIAHPALAQDAARPTPAQEAAQRYRSAYSAAIDNPNDVAAGERLLALLPQVKTTFGPKRIRYLVEGDILLTRDQFRDYRLQKKKAREDDARRDGEIRRGLKPRIPQGLAANRAPDGSTDRWRQNERTLRYAVLRHTFPSDAAYTTVVYDMRKAAFDWQKLCQACKIRFDYRPEFDDIDWEDFRNLAPRDQLRFVVVYSKAQGKLVATAFYPSTPWEQRVVNILPAYFNGDGDGRGVLRHELGHVLGYRHEHTRAVAGCIFEDSNWEPVTPYDPKSIMHYWCGDGGTRDLSFSDLDRQGHRLLYDPNAADVN